MPVEIREVLLDIVLLAVPDPLQKLQYCLVSSMMMQGKATHPEPQSR